MKAQEDKLLDDLFDSARNAAPEYTFKETKKAFLSAAVIGAAVLGLKTISSSILKTKFFIMTISTVSIISSAVLFYNTTVTTPAELTANHSLNEGKSKNVVMAMPAPNLFNEVLPQEIIPVEPDDTTKKIEEVEVIEKEIERIEITKNLKLDSLIAELTNINVMEVGDGVNKKMIVLSGSDTVFIQNMGEIEAEISKAMEIVRIEIDGQLEELEELKVLAETDRLEMLEDMDELKHERRVIIMKDRSRSHLHKVSFTINDHTFIEELEEIKDKAVAAGIDFTYTAKVKKNQIKKLDLNMKLENENGSNEHSQIYLTKSRGEVFSINIEWYENEIGEAVSFSKSKDKNKNCCDEH